MDNATLRTTSPKPSRTRRPKQDQTAPEADWPRTMQQLVNRTMMHGQHCNVQNQTTQTRRQTAHTTQTKPRSQTAKASQTGFGHQAAQTRLNLMHRATSTKNPSPQRAEAVNRDAVVGPKHKFARNRGENLVFLLNERAAQARAQWHVRGGHAGLGQRTKNISFFIGQRENAHPAQARTHFKMRTTRKRKLIFADPS
jgi:hypothetical protein